MKLLLPIQVLWDLALPGISLQELTQNPVSLQVSRSVRAQSSYNSSGLQEKVTTDLTDTFLGSHSPAVNIRFLFCILKFLPGTFAWISFL